MRREIPILITFFVGIFMILKFFFTNPNVLLIAEEIETLAKLTLTGSMILGVVNILRINIRSVVQQRRSWVYSAALVFCVFMMTFAGFYSVFVRGYFSARELGDIFFHDVYMSAQIPLGSTMFALLAFYIASAAFRAFRVRNLQAGLLLTAAVFIMIGRVPLGKTLSNNIGLGDFIPNMTTWIMGVPNTAGQRSIFIGVALGVVAVGLRCIFGVERPYLRGGD
jgi:hypothetical protein